MKVFAISDLHLSINNPKPMNIFGPVWNGYFEKIVADWQKKVGNDDIVLLAGDFSWAMKLEDAKADIELIKDLKGKKILLKGNHDYWWNTIKKVREILPDGMYAIQNDCLVIDNYIFCGTRGWSLEGTKKSEFDDKKIYDREVIRLELSLKQAIENNKDGTKKIICMMHYPPFDKNNNPTPFTNLIEKYGVKTVVYGHLHGKVPNAKKVFNLNGVTYYLTSCDMVDNTLIEIETD